MNEHESRHTRPGGLPVDEPMPHGATEPVDVVQVRADDALIAALAGADDLRVDDPIDERLAGLLRSWRDDVHDNEPQLPLVDAGAATAAMVTAPRPRRRQNVFGPWATAAAVLLIAFVGFGMAARDAQPGDALWNVTRVLYSEKAKSVEAAVTVRTRLDEADRLIKTGNVTAAMFALEEARTKLPVIQAEDGQQALATRTEELLAELVGPSPSTSASVTTSVPADTTTSVAPSESTVPATSTTTAPPTTTTTTTPSPSEPSPSVTSPVSAAPGGGTPGSADDIPPPAGGSGEGSPGVGNNNKKGPKSG